MMHVALLALAVAAAPQAPQDGRWLAFEGCWVPELVGTEDAPSHMVCVRRVGEDAVFGTWQNGALQSEQTLRADGVVRAVEEGGCSGTEVAEWSADGRRVFIRQDLTCENTPRSSRTVLAVVSEGAFADVRAVSVGDESVVRSLRYRAMPLAQYPEGFALGEGEGLARETARLHAAAALDEGAVIEASRMVGEDAVNGLLAARRAGFDLDAASLKRLAAAGVARSTIDVMVALTYPDRFAVAEEPAIDPTLWRPHREPRPNPEFDAYVADRTRYWEAYRYGSGGLGFYNRFLDCQGFGYFGYSNCYSPYAYNYRAGGIWVYPVPTTGPGDGIEGTRSGTMSSQGYRRGGSTSQGTARPRSGGDGWAGSAQPARGAASARPDAGSGSGSGSVSSGGHSSGSGTQSKGTAKPRGEGGQ